MVVANCLLDLGIIDAGGEFSIKLAKRRDTTVYLTFAQMFGERRRLLEEVGVSNAAKASQN